MSNFKTFVLVAATGAATSFGAVSMATAADAQSVDPKMVVHFKPADLNSEEGIQRIYLQIRAAAESVCPSISTGTYLVRQQTLSCRKAAIASAVDAIHNKRLVEIASTSKFV